MHGRPFFKLSIRGGQKGATLLIGLVLLVVMTLLGLTSTRLATFQTIMASNVQLQTLAMSRAERTVIAGEQDVRELVGDDITHDFSLGDDHRYLAGIIDASVPDWQDPNRGFEFAATATGRYVVEYAGIRPIMGESYRMEDPLPGSSVHSFVISAESQSARGARRVLQTVFVTEDAP